jgi:putative membrane protein
VIAFVSVAGAGFAGYTAYAIWRAAGHRASEDEATTTDRSRFIAEVGMAISALFALILLGQWAAVVILGPCIPLPRVPFTPDAMVGIPPVLLAHVGQTLAPHDLWKSWSLNPGIVLPLIWGGVLYGAGLRSAPRRYHGRSAAFAAGCLVLALALLSPLHALSEVLFSAHMAQHTLLIAVAAPLIVLGRPLLVSLWMLPRARRRTLAHHEITRAVARGSRLGVGPGFVLHAVTVWIWHAPTLYQASLANGWMHALQHTSFLVTAILFWGALLDPRRRHSYGTGVLYLFVTAAHTGVLGALMTVAPAGWYPRYAATTEAWGFSLLADQQLAGLIMWMPAGLLYTAAALLMLAAWLRESEQRALAAARRPAASAGES